MLLKKKLRRAPHRYNPRLDVRDFGICMIDGIVSDDSKSTAYDNLDSLAWVEMEQNQNYIDKDELAPAKRKEAEYKSVPDSILHEFYVNCAPDDISHYHVNSNLSNAQMRATVPAFENTMCGTSRRVRCQYQDQVFLKCAFRQTKKSLHIASVHIRKQCPKWISFTKKSNLWMGISSSHAETNALVIAQ